MVKRGIEASRFAATRRLCAGERSVEVGRERIAECVRGRLRLRISAAPRRGMALMDVLVAGMVLSGALVAVLGIAGRALNAQLRGQQIEEAAMVLDSLLNEVLAVGPAEYLKVGEMSGVIEPPFEQFTYRIVIDDITPSEPFRVTARVWWNSGGGEQTAEVQTLMARRLGEEPDPEREPTQPAERP